MKRIAILQSNYIPWKGYFDIINSVDVFVIYDDVQYTARDWRNRNNIKTSNGPMWLTIPVEVKGRYHQLIKDVKISDTSWSEKHLNAIRHNYSKSKYFNEYRDAIVQLYQGCTDSYLSNINYIFIKAITAIMGIKTQIVWSHDYCLPEGKNEKLIALCKHLGATEYLSGPSAKNYMNQQLFCQENIQVSWMNYENYPEYNQFHPPFTHNVSILDLLFHAGPESPYYIWGWRNKKPNINSNLIGS